MGLSLLFGSGTRVSRSGPSQEETMTVEEAFAAFAFATTVASASGDVAETIFWAQQLANVRRKRE